MVDKDMLLAMSQLIDAKLKPVQNKLEDMEMNIESIKVKTSELQAQIDTIRLDMKLSERSIKKDINKLYDGMDTLIAVLEHKGILPKAE